MHCHIRIVDIVEADVDGRKQRSKLRLRDAAINNILLQFYEN
jgi:hypothetical protein